jgi:hypothetical protein
VTDWFRKRRFLSKEADAFKTRMISLITQEKLAELGRLAGVMKSDPCAMFSIYLVFYFPEEELVNASFGKRKKDGSPAKDAAQTRYKRMDAENRIKLVVDSFATAVGIDDSIYFCGGHAKCNADKFGLSPQVHIYFNQVEPARFGL